MLTVVRTAIAVFSLAAVFSADVPALPSDFTPLPSELPVSASQPARPIVRRPNVSVPRPAVRPFSPAARAFRPVTVGDDVLAWDSVSKEYTAQPGELTATLGFVVTNVSKSNVVINWVRPSCGCTAARLPPTPWTLAPGEGGTMEFAIDLKGKFGILSKYVTVDTSAGQKLLNLKVTIPRQPQMAAGGLDARARNMQIALADRQAVFRGDCASCHATPTAGRKGEQLYAAACAICHDAPHRATMVPDLRTLPNATGKDYWAHWITHGKPGSLMPAFAKAQGGPLDDEQIASLAEFLHQTFPKAPATTPPNTTTASLPGTAAVHQH